MSKMQCKYCLSEQMVGITAYHQTKAGWLGGFNQVNDLELNFCEDCGLVTVVRLGNAD